MIRIELPWPNGKLNPNSSKGRHWGSTTALRAIARTEAWGLMREALGRIPLQSTAGTFALSITFVQPDKRARDIDNLLAALKPSIDGIADAMKVNDAQFNPITITRAYGARPGCVLVEVS